MEQRVSERVDERQTRHYKLILFVVHVFYTIIMNVICCRKGAGGDMDTYFVFPYLNPRFRLPFLRGSFLNQTTGLGREWEGGICKWGGGGGGNGVQD